jgi:hypothetical protein
LDSAFFFQDPVEGEDPEDSLIVGGAQQFIFSFEGVELKFETPPWQDQLFWSLVGIALFLDFGS